MIKNKKNVISKFEGKRAPEFCLLNEKGEEKCLKNILKNKKKVLLFFYPKDMTSGCTKEAISFSENIKEINDKNIDVFGISKLDSKSKRKFIEKNDLKISLLADEKMEICDKYGVLVEKNMYGRKYMGINRETFLISENGIIIKHWQKVKAGTHIDDVIKYIEEN